MVCKTTSTIRCNARRRAFTLVEMLVAVGLGSILTVAVLALAYFSTRSFSALTNYVDLDNYSRNALDHITKEIRQANALLGASEHKLVFQFADPFSGAAYNVTYLYSPTARTLTRIQGTQRKEVLRECDYLRFSIYQRNTLPGTWDQYPTAVASTCKLVQLSWICSRTILGARVNTESVQSAKVVIRKK